MKKSGRQGGRPRRSEEQPDSAFGKALKEHLRRVENFTQAELATGSVIPEKTLSQMVKGKREGGPAFRRDLRSIIKVLHQKKALLTLEEANRLLTTIPAVSPLDARNPEDLEIINLFDAWTTAGEQTATQDNAELAGPDAHAPSQGQSDVSLSHPTPEPAIPPHPLLPSPVAGTTGSPELDFVQFGERTGHESLLR